jgi:uncharacterized membrane protein HdeD (DUF308 family)
MSTTRILGVILLVVGVVLIIIGVTATRSLPDRASSFFLGHLTTNTLWYIIGGVVSAVVGLVLMLGAFRSRS